MALLSQSRRALVGGLLLSSIGLTGARARETRWPAARGPRSA
jgi:hypothetical protein